MYRNRLALTIVICLAGELLATPCVAADLPSCARRYGELRVDHALTVDSMQQLERLLYYQPPKPSQREFATRYRQQQAAINNTEREFNDAATLYAALFKSESKVGVEKLSAALDHIADSTRHDQEQVEALLTELGRQVAGADFRASPISREQLAPAWNLQTMVDENHRPTRLLFGCTGHVGDDRILPLRFDFGSGVYSFYVPMSARDKLDVAVSPAGDPDAVHRWMSEHGMGHHYWAGVYNNQNTYVADWFVKRHGNDNDVWMKLVDGKVLKPAGGGWGQPNIWNAAVRDYIANYCETQSRYFHDDPSLVCYDYAGEPHPYAESPGPHDPQYNGYNDSAIAAFRVFLQKKFGTIGALNRAWKSAYSDFDAIQPPPDPYATPQKKATPLSYEFQLFRCRGQTDFWKLVYDAYRKHDSRRPVEAHASMYMSGWPAQAMDAYQMLKAGVADWIDMHQNNFPPNLPEQIYLYSLCRLTGRVPVEFEYIWTFPRTGPVEDGHESDYAATCRASVWRNLVWGKRALVFFDFYYDWPGYRNGMFDKDLGYSILRSSACVIPAVKRHALRFNDMFMNTEVESPPIIVLQPTASVWNSPPVHPHDGFSFHTTAAMKVHELLYPRNYPFLYVPEEAVLADGYELAKHRAIILPQAPYLPAAMTDALLKWVRDGGTLICTGIPGIWTPYGEDDLRLVNTVFGKSQVADASHGMWRWQWKLVEQRPGVDQLSKDSDGYVRISRARYSKGQVLIASSGFDSDDDRQVFYQSLDASIGKRPAHCGNDSFELAIRTGNGGRYLCVLNPDTRHVREDEVIVQGAYPHSEDLGVGSGVPLPVATRDGESHFKLRLHPGESTAILLKP